MTPPPKSPTWIQYRLLTFLESDPLGSAVMHDEGANWLAMDGDLSRFRVRSSTVHSLYQCGLLEESERSFFEGRVVVISKRGKKYLNRLRKEHDAT